MRTQKQRKNIKPIAFRDNTINYEKLPLSIVLYPPHYGSFFGFKETEWAEIYFCECSRQAISNYVNFRLTDIWTQYGTNHLHYSYVLSSKEFPLTFVTDCIKRKIPSNQSALEFINYKENLCHECKRNTPEYRYCHEMYGGAFKQNYGWYINKQSYEFGLEIIGWPELIRVMPEFCPSHITDLLKTNDVLSESDDSTIINFKIQESEPEKQKRKIMNIVEDEVRLKFNHKKIGESWVNETILYNIIKNLYPSSSVFRHYRPIFLEGLEFDVFIQELNLAIEYQGIQHFKSFKHLGGDKAFEKLKIRDAKKVEICKKYGISLLFFSYEEHLSEKYVESKIKSMF